MTASPPHQRHLVVHGGCPSPLGLWNRTARIWDRCWCRTGKGMLACLCEALSQSGPTLAPQRAFQHLFETQGGSETFPSGIGSGETKRLWCQVCRARLHKYFSLPPPPPRFGVQSTPERTVSSLLSGGAYGHGNKPRPSMLGTTNTPLGVHLRVMGWWRGDTVHRRHAFLVRRQGAMQVVAPHAHAVRLHAIALPPHLSSRSLSTI